MTGTAPQSSPRAGAGLWTATFVAVLVRPGLWAVALRQLVRLARTGWWRRFPFLPLPDAGYLRFRFETAYGAGRVARPSDVVAYLRWCRGRRS
jgi:hypothetical protein